MRRDAKIFINPQDLKALLGLPEGMSVSRVYSLHDPMTLVVHVSAPWLAEIEEGVEAPILEGAWDREIRDIDGELWVRWGWDPEMPTAEEFK